MINLEELLDDHNIACEVTDYDWIRVDCPFCTGENQSKLYAGFVDNGKSYTFSCWRCGTHWFIDALKALTNTSETRIMYELVNQYDDDRILLPNHASSDNRPFSIYLPDESTNVIRGKAKQYLENRGFDVDYLKEQFNVQYLDQYSKSDYRGRIIIPYYYKSKLVCFNTRSYTGDKLRYKAPPKKKQVVIINDMLFNYDRTMNYKQVLVVEGAFDCMKLSQLGVVNTVALSGAVITPSQMYMLQQFDEVVLLLDSESEIQRNIKRYLRELAWYTKVRNFKIKSRDYDDAGTFDVEAVSALRSRLNW